MSQEGKTDLAHPKTKVQGSQNVYQAKYTKNETGRLV